MKRFLTQDTLLRCLVLMCGAIAAVLLIQRGDGEALLPLAIGAAIGTCFVTLYEARQGWR
jgi:hypothetical protein